MWETHGVGSCTSWLTETATLQLPATASIFNRKHELGASFFKKMAVSCGHACVPRKIGNCRKPVIYSIWFRFPFSFLVFDFLP